MRLILEVLRYLPKANVSPWPLIHVDEPKVDHPGGLSLPMCVASWRSIQRILSSHHSSHHIYLNQSRWKCIHIRLNSNFQKDRTYVKQSTKEHFHIIFHGIHPSTKSPLAGAAWSFSLSQARQLCNAGLSVATLRQAAGDFKGNVVKSCSWNRSDGCILGVTRINLTIGTFCVPSRR